jgi:intein/homing endonuclease
MKNYQKLAELLGIILGDGNLNKKSNCITIVGSLEDFHYHKNYVIPLIKSVFNCNPKLRKRNDRNAFYVDFNSKEIMNYLTQNIGLIRGNKVNAEVPSIIKNIQKLIPYFLRGLFDTDGCLKFSKQAKDWNYYPRVQFCFRKTKFAWQVKELLEKLNFSVGTWEENRFNGLVFFQISGKDNLERWMRIINPNNMVHKTKYLVWKRYGFYKPKSSLKSRIESLNLYIHI